MASRSKASKSNPNKEKIKRLKREKKGLEEKLADLKERLRDLEEKRRSLHVDLENAREYGDSFENQDIENINLEIQQVEKNIIKVSQEIENLESEISKIDQEIEELQKKKDVKASSSKALNAIMNSYLKDYLSRILLEREFKVTYPSELEKELGVKDLKVRFVLSDEHILLDGKEKAISINSPLGKAIMTTAQGILKEEFKRNLLEILAENLSKYVSHPVKEEKEKGKKSKRRRRKSQTEEESVTASTLSPTLKNIVEKIVDTTLLGLNKTPSEFLETIRRTLEKIDIRLYIPGLDDNKAKILIRDSLQKALGKTLENLELDKFEIELDLPERGPTKVKVKTLKR